jgi:hypothetical protein
MVLAHKNKKYEDQRNRIEDLDIIHTAMATLFLTKVPKTYDGE